MAQTDISPEKIKAYEATHYCAGVGPDAFVLRIGQHSRELALRYEQYDAYSALFITAFNPFGEKQDEDANKNAHARLGQQLQEESVRIIEGVGSDPTYEWREKSYLAFGIDADAARRLGHSFQQDAVVWIGKDAIPQLLLLR